MDPLTAGLALAKALLESNDLRFKALKPEDQTAEAQSYFDELQRLREFGAHIVDLFHPKG